MLDHFGRYILLKRLAVGGMAEIFLAKQTGLQGFEKLVVVKRILPSLCSEKEFVQMFLDEARLAASLTHPHIVQIYDLGQVDSLFFIAMEFVAGHDLNTVIKRGRALGKPLPVELAAKVIAGVCEGLHHAHTKKDLRGQPLNIVHRDVTPSNALISYEGAVKVADFGIAKAESHTSKTEAGKLKGKFSYMSPEQIRSLPLDARSDVFGLGIVLHEALSGRRLFKRDSELGILRDILEGEVRPPSTFRPEVPKLLDQIVLRALSKNRERRYASAQELQLDLERFLSMRLAQPSSLQISQYMMELFAKDHEAYQRLLAELPSARPEQLAAMIEEQSEVSGSASLEAAFTDPSLSPPSAKLAEKEAVVIIPAWRRPGALLALAGALALAVALAAFLFSAPKPTVGFLTLETDPTGAAVFLDGQPTEVKTPGVLNGMPLESDHLIRFELEGRETRETRVRLTRHLPSKALSLVLPAKKAPAGQLAITTLPPGATVLVDGRTIGPSPVSVDLDSGVEHWIRASKEGFLDEAKTVGLEPGKRLELLLSLKAKEKPDRSPASEERPVRERRAGTVELSSEPAAEVLFQGQRLGRTPLAARLPLGKATLTFVNPELELSQTVTLEVASGQSARSFSFAKGKLAADATPWADVYLGNRKLGTTPLAPRDLYEGTYTLRLVNSELGAIKTIQVVVHPNRTTVVRQAMQ